MEKPLLPKLNDDGTVDYRELDSINTVNKEDVLAEIIPPTDGEEGKKLMEIQYHMLKAGCQNLNMEKMLKYR